MNEEINRALAITIWWCAIKNGTRKNSQERLKSDLGVDTWGKIRVKVTNVDSKSKKPYDLSEVVAFAVRISRHIALTLPQSMVRKHIWLLWFATKITSLIPEIDQCDMRAIYAPYQILFYFVDFCYEVCHA